MKAIIISILVIFTSSFCKAEQPLVKYVWAPNGLNMRTAPSISSPIITKLAYGDVITLLEETEEIYHTVFITKNSEIKEQILLKHTWVKVIKEGVEGYVIDGYLLDFVAPRSEDLGTYNTTLKNTYDAKNIILSQNDMSVNTYLLGVELPNDKSIKISNYSELEGEIYFENFTHQEILIFLNKFIGLENNPLSGFGKNWAEKKDLYFEMLIIEIENQQDGITRVEMNYEGC